MEDAYCETKAGQSLIGRFYDNNSPTSEHVRHESAKQMLADRFQMCG